MCEFKVYLKDVGGESEVAEDVVYAKVLNGAIVLRDILGGLKKLNDVAIVEVDVDKEKMLLKPMPILSQLSAFISLCEQCESRKVYLKDVESLWEEVKLRGDDMVRSLRARFKDRGGSS